MDAALVGGGGAGLAVLHRLALGAPAARARRGCAPLRVAVVDPVDRLATRPADRTWCSWDVPGSEAARELAPAVHRSWRHVAVVAPDGAEQVLDLEPLRYTMVRSEDLYALVARAVDAARAAGALELLHLPVAATEVVDGAGDGAARVRTPAGDLRAAWVLDSRPHPPRREGATRLLQDFSGERVRTPAPSVDPARAVLMDFTVPQPPGGLAFGYCLPSDERTALVEHTAFVPRPVPDAEHAAALGAYRARVLGAGGVVEHAERGVIPMTDAPFARRAGRRVLRLGTGGGAVRPSTGYAFAAMRRQARAVAAQLLAGADVVPPRPYPRRHAWMDALVLRGLADGSLDGGAFFGRLFDRNPPARVLRFLDGATGPAAELALMATAPQGPMLAAVARDAAWRAARPVRRLLP